MCVCVFKCFRHNVAFAEMNALLDRSGQTKKEKKKEVEAWHEGLDSTGNDIDDMFPSKVHDAVDKAEITNNIKAVSFSI